MAIKRFFALVIGLPVVAGFLALAGVAGRTEGSVQSVAPQAQVVALPTGEPTVMAVSIERYATASAADSQAQIARVTADAYQLQADGQRAILTAEAGATVDALSARGTTQALDGQSTAQAVSVASTSAAAQAQAQDRATAQAGDATRTAQAVVATATAQAVEGTRQAAQGTRQAAQFSIDKTRTAEDWEMTRTAVAHTDNATRVALQATITRVAWSGSVERIIKPVLTVGGILFLVAVVVVGFLLAWKFSKVLEDRLRVIRPRPNEGEPIIVFGNHRWALPLRAVNPVVDATPGREDSPIIAPSVAAQMATTLAQQKSNFAQARQVAGIARAEARVPHFVRVSSRSVLAQPGPIPPGMDQGQPWQDVTTNWPHQVPLVGLFNDKRPSLQHVVIGVAPRPRGGLDVVSSTLDDMMHTLVCGASGWGKSAWLRSFLWQLAQAREPVEVIGLDVSGSEMNALAGWDKLRYPVARTTSEAVTLLQEVGQEVKRRMKLYEDVPAASKLSEYNHHTGDSLKPWVIVADEGAALLNDKATGEPLRDAIQTARQYGIYAVLATVTANATVIPTPLRDQFSTRLAFRTNSGKAVVEDNRPKDLVTKGRCWAQLSGQPLRELQGAWLPRPEFLRAMAGDGPRLALPDVAESIQVDGRAARVLELLAGDEVLSDTAIARQVYGHGNSHYIEKVRMVKAQFEQQQQQQQNDNDNGQDGV